MSNAAAAVVPLPSGGRFLVVRAGGERYGLALGAVREVVDTAPPLPVPSRVLAVRGVMPLRERYLTLVHLGALLAGVAPPDGAVSETAVVTDVGDGRVALEVDDVEAVVDSGATPVGGGSGGVLEVWRVGEDLVSVLDLDALAGRLRENGVMA